MKIRIPTIVLDSKSSLGKQKQVFNALSKWIKDGTWTSGVKLPSSRELALDLKVSRNTILAVYEQLSVEGLIITRAGSGSFVSMGLLARGMKTTLPTVSNRNDSLPPSGLSHQAQRALLSPAFLDDLEIKPFALGIPAIDKFPFQKWQRFCSKALTRIRSQHFGFGDVQGRKSFREAICSHVSIRRGVKCDPSQVIVLSSAQQAFDLISRLILNENDVVVHEEPGYFLARGTFQLHGAKIAFAKVDDDGANTRSVSRSKKIKFAYLTPSHQQPLGMSMPYDRRIEWLQFAQKNDCWIVEDDFDSEYRYDVDPIPALQSLDQNERVIYIGSFSKTMYPGIRAGFLILPKALVEPCLAIRAYGEGFASTVVQDALAEFMDSGAYASHIRKMRCLYRERFHATTAILNAHLGGFLKFSIYETGLHISGVFLNPTWDDVQLVGKARDAGIELKPLSIYFAGEAKKNGLVFGFASWEKTEIEEATRRLTAFLNRMRH